MKIKLCSAIALAVLLAPAAATWAQDPNPGNSGGGNAPIATPTYVPDPGLNPALTTGSRLSVTTNTPADENPSVPGATGETIVRGDRSTISGDRRATIEQKTGGLGGESPGG
ncbi:MAG: hypothetical protein QOF70_5857 [Acetobacteraceae bacterium]|jgi:hypothetical protein|nr:hypothetical protein [Acetobacteraceae bacterium]